MRSLLLCGVLVVVGCTPPPELPIAEVRQERFGGVQLVLNNKRWLDVVVYVEHDGETSRIGQVTAASSRIFRVPAWILGSAGLVRLVADPVGEPGRELSDWVNVPGAVTLEWTLEHASGRSSLLLH